MMIRKVWIEEGCISCNLCQDLASSVFEVPPGSTSILKKGYQETLQDERVQEQVHEAADSCPVEVIQVEHS
jgi:ferredoxin